jgi:SulP family sulfate permease
VLRDAIERLEHRGITVYLSGIRDGHAQALTAIGVLDRLHRQGKVFTHTGEAIVAARTHLHHIGVLSRTTRSALQAG